jgi:primosomal protein N' (replication factor Y)
MPLDPTGARVLRTAPSDSRLAVVVAARRAVAERDLLVLLPEHRDVDTVVELLGRAGHPVARVPEEWARARAGGVTVVGTRRAAFAPVGDLGGIVVLDAHAESYVDERAPTADATVLVAERARAAGVPCVLVSPTPPLGLLARHPLLTAPGAARWPPIEVIDRRDADPRSGAYDPRLVAALRRALAAEPRRRAICVFNRTGRVRLIGCGTCGALARCTVCGHALNEPERAVPGAARVLVCPSCGERRPWVCGACGSTRLRQVRVGVRRVAEEIGVLLREPVSEVTGTTTDIPVDARVLVGTEAVLHRVSAASLVAFVDFDQEILGSRFLALEQAWVLLGRAARLLGADAGRLGRRIVVQTRLPDEPLLAAARSGDPSRFLDTELERRRALRLPPASALCALAGEGVEAVVAFLRASAPEVEVAWRADHSALARAATHEVLLDALGAVRAAGLGCRVAVDPRDV